MERKFYSRVIAALLAFVSALPNMMADKVSLSFYVYRNDGDFNALFFADVDSIVHSNIDVDSIVRERPIVTEFWTPDSVYRIPMAAIDSISFVTPSTIRKPGVIDIEERLESYVAKVDSLTLFLDKNIPTYLIPTIGDKLTRITVDGIMPNGFIGRVKSIGRGGEYLTVECDSIGIADAFDRIYLSGIVDAATGESLKARTKMRKRNVVTTELPDIEAKLPIDLRRFWTPVEDYEFGVGAEMNFSLNGRPTARYVYVRDLGDTFLSLQIDTDWTLTSDIKTYGYFEVSKEIALLRVDRPLPIPYIPFIKVYAKTGPVVKFSGELALETSRKDRFFTSFAISQSTNPQIRNISRVKKVTAMPGGGWDAVNFSGNLNLFCGVYAEIGVGLIVEDMGKVYARGELGMDFDLSCDISLSDYKDASKSSDMYKDNLISAKGSCNLKTEVALGVSSKVSPETFGWSIDHSWKKEFKKPIFESNIFPEFEESKYEDGEISYVIKGNVPFKVIPGVKVTDLDGKEIFVAKSPTEYWDSNYENITFTYEHNIFNKRCKIYPTFEIFGYDVMAEPAADLIKMVLPETGGCGSIRPTTAVVIGKLSEPIVSDEANPTVYSVGFLYSQDAENLTSGTRCVAAADTAGRFSYKFTGLKDDTEYHYMAFLYINGEYYYGTPRSFKTLKNSDVVDLGLSVLWGTKNLGAALSNSVGNLYAWGEKNSKSDYSWTTYFDNPYDASGEWVGCSIDKPISGTSYDPAKSKGDGWRMPTRDEVNELLTQCTWEWIVENGVNGYLVTGKNGNNIFLPATGLGDGTSVNNRDSYGAYWTGTPSEAQEGRATASSLYFYGTSLKSLQWVNRYGGRAIRPVLEK